MNLTRKCAIIGCGNVGATTAFSLAKSKLFSEIVLIDIDKKRAQGEADDINHALPFISPMDIYAGDYADLSGADIIIITAGASQAVGETRIDLLKRNAKIFESIVKNITIYNRDAIILVVTNPVDILTQITLSASGLPATRVFGSGTVLDTARLKYLLGKKFDVDPRNVHAFIIGEHGDSELPVWSSANISGIDLDSYCDSCHESCNQCALDALFEEAKNGAYRIIESKGATYYAIAESVLRIVSAIILDENAILPLSAHLDGEYGISDVCLGVPCIVGAGGIKKVLEIPLSDEEHRGLAESAEKLHKSIRSIDMITV